MRNERRWTVVALGVLAVAVIAGLSAAVAGFVLAGQYRPSAPGVDPGLLPGRVRSSVRWTDRHEQWSLVALGATLLGVGLVAWLHVEGRLLVRRGVLLVAGLLAVLSPLVTILTRPLVQWDQLALRTVTTGADLDGYRVAAFDDRVRFLFVDGAEVSQGEYATMLVAHLAAPVLGVVALLVLVVALVRATGARRGDGDNRFGAKEGAAVASTP